jgi:uncharacterized protein
MRRILWGLLFFFGGIILLSAMLSPWIYWGVDFYFPGDVPFRRVFNRVLMLAALGLLWPLAHIWGIRSWRELGIHSLKKVAVDLPLWFGWGVVTVAGLYVVQILAGERAWVGSWAWLRGLEFLVSAWAVGLLEEILFRGLMFLALFRVLKDYAGSWIRVAVLTSLFFATTHYLKATNPPGEITWNSGWISWGIMLSEFRDLQMLALRWLSLCLVGLVLCVLAKRTNTLWGCMGLHAGWVFGLKMLNQTTEWKGGAGSWWFQADILSGLSAEMMLLGVLWFILFRMKDRSLSR